MLKNAGAVKPQSKTDGLFCSEYFSYSPCNPDNQALKYARYNRNASFPADTISKHPVMLVPEYQHGCKGKSQTLTDEWFLCRLWCQQGCSHSFQPKTNRTNKLPKSTSQEIQNIRYNIGEITNPLISVHTEKPGMVSLLDYYKSDAWLIVLL